MCLKCYKQFFYKTRLIIVIKFVVRRVERKCVQGKWVPLNTYLPILKRGITFCDFLFASLDDVALQNGIYFCDKNAC